MKSNVISTDKIVQQARTGYKTSWGKNPTRSVRTTEVAILGFNQKVARLYKNVEALTTKCKFPYTHISNKDENGITTSKNQALFWHRNVGKWSALSLARGTTVSAICAVSAAGSSVLLRVMFLPSTGDENFSGKKMVLLVQSTCVPNLGGLMRNYSLSGYILCAGWNPSQKIHFF